MANAGKGRGWVDGFNAIHRKQVSARVWRPDLGVPCNPYEVVTIAAKFTPSPVGSHSLARSHRYIGFRQGQIFLSSVVGAMGSGMPMPVAAALRRPETQVVAFLGDGGALMMGNEIATACQYGTNQL